jgi:hypothetical protein
MNAVIQALGGIDIDMPATSEKVRRAVQTMQSMKTA